jgi:hypothetical protein
MKDFKKVSPIYIHTYILEWWNDTIHMAKQNEIHKKSDMWQVESQTYNNSYNFKT